MSINVRPEFLQTANEEVNKEAVRYSIGEIFPSSGANLTGDVHFDFSTGANEYLDLYKLSISADIDLTITHAGGTVMDMLSNCFSRGQLYINGYLVATSNSYPHDNILNKRLAFSQTYNERINRMISLTDANVAAGTGGEPIAATTVDLKYYDNPMNAFSIMHPGMFLPPNTQLKMILSVAPNAQNQALVTTNAGGTTALTLANLKMHTYVLASPVKTPETYQLTLVTADSFKSTCAATTNAQYTAKNSLVRVSADFTSTTSAMSVLNLGGDKGYVPTVFRYPTDYVLATGLPAANSMTSLSFKVGAQQLPQVPFSGLVGMDNLVNQFNALHDGDLDPSGGESRDFYLARGPIYTVPVVRSATDHPRTIEMQAVFLLDPVAHAHITAHYEQICTFNYGAMGEPIGFTKTV